MSKLNLYRMLEFWADRWPDRIAVKAGGRSATWNELRSASAAIAGGLAELGIGEGDSVGILMHNRLEFVETILAVLRLGGRVTVLNVRFTPNEFLHPIGDAAIKFVVTQPELLASLADARRAFSDLRTVLCEGPADGVTATIDAFRANGVQGEAADVDENATALICYSSGTTGFPKGVMLSHRNVREGGLATAIPCGMTHDDRVLICAPLAYTWGICQYLRESLATGATATIVDPEMGVDEMMDVLVEDRITLWSAVPVFFERIAASPRFASLDLSGLRHVVTGGASLHLLQTWQDKGVPLAQAYGLTESGGGHVAMLFNEDIRSRIGWVGRPLMGVDIMIATDEGRPLSAGQDGEILVRGPMVMQGYLNSPEETARAMSGEWLRTGDIGMMDEAGYLKVTGRKKDMLRSGGLNVYPAEIERVLAGVRGLAEFAVIGVSDERWGEVPMIVTHDPDAPDIDTLTQRCLSGLAGYKRPRYLWAYGKPLPRTFSGKIMKHVLQQEFASPPEGALSLHFKS